MPSARSVFEPLTDDEESLGPHRKTRVSPDSASSSEMVTGSSSSRLARPTKPDEARFAELALKEASSEPLVPGVIYVKGQCATHGASKEQDQGVSRGSNRGTQQAPCSAFRSLSDRFSGFASLQAEILGQSSSRPASARYDISTWLDASVVPDTLRLEPFTSGACETLVPGVIYFTAGDDTTADISMGNTFDNSFSESTASPGPVSTSTWAQDGEMPANVLAGTAAETMAVQTSVTPLGPSANGGRAAAQSSELLDAEISERGLVSPTGLQREARRETRGTSWGALPFWACCAKALTQARKPQSGLLLTGSSRIST